MRAWEQQPHETAAAYRAFSAYRDLGQGRTLAAAADVIYNRPQPGTKQAPGVVKGWARTFEWIDRAQAYDSYLELVRQDAIAEHVKRRATSFEDRLFRLQEARLALAEQVVERMRQMAASPLYQTTERVEEDGQTVLRVYEPAGWNFATISRLDTLVGALAKGASPEVIVAWDTVSTDELNRVISGEDVRVVLTSRDEMGRLIGSGRDV